MPNKAVTQGSGDGHTKNINGINAVQVGFLGVYPYWAMAKVCPVDGRASCALTSAMRPPA